MSLGSLVILPTVLTLFPIIAANCSLVKLGFSFQMLLDFSTGHKSINIIPLFCLYDFQMYHSLRVKSYYFTANIKNSTISFLDFPISLTSLSYDILCDFNRLYCYTFMVLREIRDNFKDILSLLLSFKNNLIKEALELKECSKLPKMTLHTPC